MNQPDVYATKAIAFVADDPPIRDDVLGWGLMRVNSRLVGALGGSVKGISCSSLGLYSPADLPAATRAKTWMWGRPTHWQRWTKRLFGVTTLTTRSFDGHLAATSQAVRDSGADVIFCPCGVDPAALGRAVAVKRATHLPLAVYFVDDFLDGALLAKNAVAYALARDRVPGWMKEIDRAFVISDGLKERFDALYGTDAIVLPLPHGADALAPASVAGGVKDQVIFVGNLSHFYAPGLRELAMALADLRRRGIDITLRFTMPSRESVQEIVGTAEGIECRPCATSNELRNEVATSIAAFAPYSFADEHAVMVKTSFPSKMLDYLSSARLILAHGPAYSTAARYFAENGLDAAITEPGAGALADLIEGSRDASHSQSASYRHALLTNHAPADIARRIHAGLA
jgi:hypothetical protein